MASKVLQAASMGSIVSFVAFSSLLSYIAARRRKSKKLRIVIPDLERYQTKRKRLVEGGLRQLQIIADFDRTISSYIGPTGERGDSAHGIVEGCRELSQHYHTKVKALFKKYFPLETTTTLTVEEKIPYMETWYSTGHNLLLKENFHRSYITQAVHHANIQLREGAYHLFRLVDRLQIPLMVFSAGLGDVLQEVIIQKYGTLSHNVHIVSNWMNWDRAGRLIGFSEPLIHMFNKDDRHVRNTPYHETLASRKHVLLMGDGLGDITMANEDDHDVVLRIGFLNHDEETLLPKYRQVYDLIILDDGTMEPAIDIIEATADTTRTQIHAVSTQHSF